MNFACVQEPFNTVRYAIIGDDAATNYFRINAESGAIQISNNLENDATRTYSVSNAENSACFARHSWC